MPEQILQVQLRTKPLTYFCCGAAAQAGQGLD